MRLFLSLCAAIALASLLGCGRSKLVVEDSSGHKADISVDGGKSTTVTSDKPDKDESGAHFSLHDEDGKGLSFDADHDGLALKVKSDEGDTSLQTQKDVSEAQLGLPFYPGSSVKDQGALVIDTPDEKGVVACRTTTDEPAKVADFYKPLIKVTSLASVEGDDESRIELKGTTPDGREVGVDARREKGETKTSVSVAVMQKKPK